MFFVNYYHNQEEEEGKLNLINWILFNSSPVESDFFHWPISVDFWWDDMEYRASVNQMCKFETSFKCIALRPCLLNKSLVSKKCLVGMNRRYTHLKPVLNWLHIHYICKYGSIYSEWDPGVEVHTPAIHFFDTRLLFTRYALKAKNLKPI